METIIKNNIESLDILTHIYYMGTSTRQQKLLNTFIKNNYAKKIQKWYKSKINPSFEGDGTPAEEKRDFIRLIFLNYKQEWLDDYVNGKWGVINKCSYRQFPPYNGTKKSELRKWMFENMTLSDLYYQGY